MAGISKTKRITYKHNRPNPLFQSWLQELYNEAKAKKSKLENMLKVSLESLSKYPLPLQTGEDCAILQGFGKKLCKFLDHKLEVYNNGCINQDTNINNVKNTQPCSDQSPESVEVDGCLNSIKINTQNIEPKKNKTKSPKKYKPAHRSGGYAILLALLSHAEEQPSATALKKEELIERAQPFSEESFVRPKPESFYTAWSVMPRLITKGLVNKCGGRKAEYSLTNEGRLLAEELRLESQSIHTVNDIIFNDPQKPSTSKQYQENLITAELSNNDQNLNNCLDENRIEMAAGTFDVVLLIDKMETSGLSKKNDPTVAQFNKYKDLKHEYRHLKVGDFTWIARSKIDNNQELVLPFIVERKRMDDLGSSIKDGRFHEQKFRLRKCGLNTVIYLVENYGSNKNLGLPYQSLMQALANTRVHDDFKVHITDSLTGSAKFLAMMTKRLTIKYKDNNLRGAIGEPKDDEFMTFQYFNKSSCKNKTLTITETFIKMLLQLKGMSVEKALVITKSYRTPRELIEKYESCSKEEGESLLANLKYGDLNRNIGPIISKSIYQLLSIKYLK